MKICTLEQVIPALRGYKKILITGPQRSGTTIASKIIAKRLSLPWMKEESVDVDNLEKFFEMHFKKKNMCFRPQLCVMCATNYLLTRSFSCGGRIVKLKNQPLGSTGSSIDMKL